MSVNSNIESIKGDRSMTQGFVAQYAAEAALQIDGVYELKPSFAVALKEKRMYPLPFTPLSTTEWLYLK
jgi:hypothetical protein